MAPLARPSLREHLRLLRLTTRDLGTLLDHLAAEHGNAVDMGYRFPLRLTLLSGPEANRDILHTHADAFLWGEALSTLLPAVGPTALVVTDGDEHDRRRRLVQPAFSRRRTDAHLDLIVDELDSMLDTWTPGSSVDAFAGCRPAIRRIVVRALVGTQLGDQADRIGELLEPALRYVNSNPAFRIDVDLRFNGFAKANRARHAVDEIVQAEIDRRRRDGVDETQPDILTSLLATSEGGVALTDAEIRDQIRSLIAAGYDTTSSAVSWLVYGLGTNPDALDALRTQVADAIGDDRPSTEALQSMPLVDGVVRETLRLWPPGSVGVRHAARDVTVAGHDIGAGTMVAYSPWITHRMPEVWGDPLAFRPERWAEGEPEPYAYVPFGGGRRNCIGFTLATLELQALAVRLAQRVRWTVPGPEPTSTAAASLAPKGGMPITVLSRT